MSKQILCPCSAANQPEWEPCGGLYWRGPGRLPGVSAAHLVEPPARRFYILVCQSVTQYGIMLMILCCSGKLIKPAQSVCHCVVLQAPTLGRPPTIYMREKYACCSMVLH